MILNILTSIIHKILTIQQTRILLLLIILTNQIIKKITNIKLSNMIQQHITGTKIKREQLQNAIDYLRAGDVLVVWKLDRLGRSLKDLLLIVNEMNQKVS